MTENEAIKELKCWLNFRFRTQIAGIQIAPKLVQATRMATEALKEVQQYRKHGITVESTLNNMCDLAAAENLIEEYRAIGTLEECRAAMEKQNAVKPTAVLGTFGGTEYECKNCGNNVENGDEYCRWCGRKLDWSDVLESNWQG